MFDAMMLPDCTNMLYNAADTARVRTVFEFLEFHATRMAWQYGYERSPVSKAYRSQGLASFFNVTMPMSHGRIQIFEDEETIDLSLKYWLTLVMMRSCLC